MWRAILAHFKPLLMLITGVIHLSKLYFAVAGSIIYLKRYLGKNLTGRKCRAYGTILYEIGRKIVHIVVVFAVIICIPEYGFLHAFTYVFFPYASNRISWFFFKLKRIICTLLLCNKKYRSPYSSLARETFLSLCACTRSFARAYNAKKKKSGVVGMRNTILKNHLVIITVIKT